MTTQTTTQFAFVDDLYDALIARPGMDDVYVSTGVVDPLKTPKPDVLMLYQTIMDQDFLTLGVRTNEEQYGVEGMITVVRPGAGVDAIQEARDRAQDILGELDSLLRETVTPTATRLGGTTSYRLASAQVTTAFSSRGQLCAVEFTIRVKAQLHAS